MADVQISRRVAGLVAAGLVVAALVGLTACGSPDRRGADRTGVPGRSAAPSSTVAPAGPTSTATTIQPPAVTPTPTTVPPASPDRIAAFRGLGTWVDTLDYSSLGPASAVAAMKGHHVRTLYLATARYDSPRDILYPAQVDAWLAAAHGAGLRVVGWYVPDLTDVARDVRRTVAIAGYRTATGDRFDAVALDIEYPTRVVDGPAWNAAVADLLVRVRAGTALPLGAITLPPVLMGGWPDPTRWAGFPWATIGRVADVVLPMDYWTSYTPARLCPIQPLYCVTAYTATNVARVRELTGRPVHVIGGVGDAATTGEVGSFVAAARTAGVVGGSLYDFRTTSAADWSSIQAFG